MAWRRFLAVGAAVALAFLLAPTGGYVQASLAIGIIGACVVALAVGVRQHRPEPARAWQLLVASTFVYWAATVVWWLYPLLSGRDLPFPSVLDVMYWAVYLGWFAFLAALIRRHTRDDAGAVFDAVIVGAGVAAFGFEVLLAPVLGSDLPAAVMVASVLYPVLLTALTAAAFHAAVLPQRATVVHAFLVGWIGLELAADVWYSLASAAGTFTYGHPWFVAWLLAYTLLGALALHPELPSFTQPAEVARAANGRARLIALALAGIAPMVGVILAEHVLGYSRQYALPARLAAVLIVLAVIVRLGLLTRDVRHGERVRAELEYALLHDGLTGLTNRLGFEQQLRRALGVRHEPGRSAMVLMADLNGFKAVNDTYGHEAGDELLREIARRLTDVVRDADTVARLGGDEFAVVVDDIDVTEGLLLADRLADAVIEPIDLGSAAPVIGVSVGVHGIEPDESPDSAMRHADTAMYAAKTAGGGVELFDAERHRRFLDRYQLELQLRAAASAGELALDYQPIVRLDGRVVVAAEALVRWHHSERGLLPPREFIELAEASGAIIDIGRWVLQQACRDAASWQRPGATSGGICVAVNVSRRQLANPGIVPDVVDALAAAGLPARLLTLEVTETAVTHDIAGMIAVMRELKALGVQLAMDDFGTGYSSLTDLQRMPIDILKIDRAFVAGIARSDEEWALASAIVQLATSLGHRTLAEGIEEPAQMAHLRSLGCELGQGFLFARPMPVDELRRTYFPSPDSG